MGFPKLRTLGMFTAAFALAAGANLTPANDFSLATPAHAESACLPGVYNPARPVQPGDCFSMAEFNKAMRAEGQQPIIVGNRNAGAFRYGEYFTSNPDGSKGVNAEMNVAYEDRASAATVSIAGVYTGIRVNDVNVSASLPSWARLNVDEARANRFCSSFNGACNSYNDYLRRNTREAGSSDDNRIMMIAQSINSPNANGQWRTGQRIVVFRDMNNGFGSINALNSEGAVTPMFGMQPVSYTQFASSFTRDQRASNDVRGTALASLTP